MLFSISHETQLSYSRAITESVMEVRAMPRTDSRQVLRQFSIDVSPNAVASHHIDWLGNVVHHFSVLGVHEQVTVTSSCTLETRRSTVELSELTAPLVGLICDHRSWDFLQDHGPVMDDPALPALINRLGLNQVRQVGQAIELVLKRTRDVISYRRGATDSTSTVCDVLRSGAGVCQDFAHLSLALLRRVGVPCRYVSGYLSRDDAGELETHAWVEAFVPGYGWIGFDPTHGVHVSEDYVAVAVGRSYADVPPNRGVYRGDAEERISVRVTMRKVPELLRLTPYSVAIEPPKREGIRKQVAVPLHIALGLELQNVQPSAPGFVVQQQRQQQQQALGVSGN